MSVLEALRLASRRLRTNLLRTALTTLGVIIGVASLVALIGVGEGTQAAITNQIAGLGTNLLSVNAGSSFVGGVRGAAGSASTLTVDDAAAIATLPGVAAVAPEMSVSEPPLSPNLMKAKMPAAANTPTANSAPTR